MEPAVAAAKAGKHVIIEKPVCLDPHDLRRLSSLARNCGRKAYTVMQLRHRQDLQMLRKALKRAGAPKLLLNATEHLYALAADDGALVAFTRRPGSSCGPRGEVHLRDVADLVAGGTATYTVRGTVVESTTGTVVNRATARTGEAVRTAQSFHPRRP